MQCFRGLFLVLFRFIHMLHGYWKRTVFHFAYGMAWIFNVCLQLVDLTVLSIRSTSARFVMFWSQSQDLQSWAVIFLYLEVEV